MTTKAYTRMIGDAPWGSSSEQGAILIAPSNYTAIGDEPDTVITDPNLPDEIALNSDYILTNPFQENCEVVSEIYLGGQWFNPGLNLETDLSSGYIVESRTSSSSPIPDIIVHTEGYLAGGSSYQATFDDSNPTAPCRVWCYPIDLTGGAG